ncbi:MAG: hypothetical protein CVV51_06145 [Spirochaetae bacterium HGW-Spirochaetae-7]|jgi:hypothetical protein|nr:MAG: hypothetical protein CVV51_06145 [Spirochaetae bacterium HGW-Spirochaetae-7]
MFKKNSALIMLFFMICAVTGAFADEGRRGAMFQLGAGMAIPIYDDGTEAFFSAMESTPGIDRITLGLNVALGYGVSPNGIILGRIDGMGDRVYDSVDFIQMNLYLYSLGYRYYPSKTGLYIEGGIGSAVMVYMDSSSYNSSSDPGLGFGVACGYDFNADIRGFGLTVEAKYNSYDIEGINEAGISLVGNLCWK